jgi:hypothetical protein
MFYMGARLYTSNQAGAIFRRLEKFSDMGNDSIGLLLKVSLVAQG